MSRSDNGENQTADSTVPSEMSMSKVLLKKLQEENTNLREENKVLKDILNQTNIAMSSQMKILGALESQANGNYEVLARHVQTLEELLIKIMERTDSSESSQFLGGPSKSAIEKDQLTHQIVDLQSKLNLLKIENEGIQILKSQVEVYKADYEELQKQNEELTRRSGTLQDELKKLNVTRKNSRNSLVSPYVDCSFQMSPFSHPFLLQERLGEIDGVPSDDSNNRNLFKCFNPACSRSFPTENLLREHIERCLNLT